ncbi:MAG: hypothetical protein SFW66_06345 [Gammaproteobacteria bacterium]|nr:hypothetical protein [Gammaproteobacteria bacterium]
MLKQILIILVLSIVIIFFMPYAQMGLNYLVDAHTWVADHLKDIFAGGEAGNIIRQLIALFVVPVLVALVPVVLYWLAKRHWFPWTMEIIWIVWLLQVAAVVLLYAPAK